MGTPGFMSPEQHLGRVAGPASDQFSFCVSLWQALYSQRPFAGDTHATLAFQVCHGDIVAPPSIGVPTWIRSLLERGLAREPENRQPLDDGASRCPRDASETADAMVRRRGVRRARRRRNLGTRRCTGGRAVHCCISSAGPGLERRASIDHRAPIWRDRTGLFRAESGCRGFRARRLGFALGRDEDGDLSSDAGSRRAIPGLDGPADVVSRSPAFGNAGNGRHVRRCRRERGRTIRRRRPPAAGPRGLLRHRPALHRWKRRA